MRAPTPGRWAMVKYDETFTGALGPFPAANLTKSNGRGMSQGSFGVTVTKAGPYLCLLYAYVSNIAAGARAEVQLLVNGDVMRATNLYVVNVGGQDQSSAHSVLMLAAGDKLTLQRTHTDTGVGRFMSGELFVQELI